MLEEGLQTKLKPLDSKRVERKNKWKRNRLTSHRAGKNLGVI